MINDSTDVLDGALAVMAAMQLERRVDQRNRLILLGGMSDRARRVWLPAVVLVMCHGTVAASKTGFSTQPVPVGFSPRRCPSDSRRHYGGRHWGGNRNPFSDSPAPTRVVLPDVPGRKVGDRFGPPREIEAIVRFARAWAYYGGPPDDELFVQFGVTRTRFAEILHLVVAELDCDPEALAPLTEIYPLAQTRRE